MIKHSILRVSALAASLLLALGVAESAHATAPFGENATASGVTDFAQFDTWGAEPPPIFQGIPVLETTAGSFAAFCIEPFVSGYSGTYTSSSLASSGLTNQVVSRLNNLFSVTVTNGAKQALGYSQILAAQSNAALYASLYGAFQVAAWDLAADDGDLDTGIIVANSSSAYYDDAKLLLSAVSAYSGAPLRAVTVLHSSDAEGQDVVYSAGTVSSVPEPQDGLMFATGLGLLGWTASRKRRRVS